MSILKNAVLIKMGDLGAICWRLNMKESMLRAAIVTVLALLTGFCGPAAEDRDTSTDADEAETDSDDADDVAEEEIGPELPPFAKPECSPEAASSIHLVDSDAYLYRFSPEDREIEEMGELYCPAVGGSPHAPLGPMSMSVDRNAVCWVLYTNGHIYWANIEGSDCIESGYIPNQYGFDTFGMGFVADGPEAETDTIFAMTGSYDDTVEDQELGKIDPATLELTPIGPGPGRAELTGNGIGELWGFFPRSEPMTIRQLDKDGGESLITYEFTIEREILPECTRDDCYVEATAWDFAYWGGRFYLFIQFQDHPSSNVYVYTPGSDEVEGILTHIGFTVVGAGVSTCAPVELI